MPGIYVMLITGKEKTVIGTEFTPRTGNNKINEEKHKYTYETK